MAFEIAGYSDKKGNEYEDYWVAKQYLRLLLEDIKSVTREPVGPDEQGVDLVIETIDGKRMFEQCKARNGSSEYWTIGDLSSKGIWTNCKKHLDRDNDNKFILISGLPAKSIGDICNSARDSNDNADIFYEYQICKQGMPRLKTFQSFCRYFSLDPEDKFDRIKALSYLKRIEFICWDCDSCQVNDIYMICNMLVAGSNKDIVSTLSTISKKNIRKEITTPILRKYLEKEALYPRQLEHDERVLPAIERLQTKFIESIKHNLINGDLIHRQETDELIEKQAKHQLIVLHGSAGKGKSGVLYEYLIHLQENSIPCIPIRLDQQEIGDNLTECYKKLELPESPLLCLKSLVTSGQKGVIIIDQLDALRWTTGHSTGAINVCKDLLREVNTLNCSGSNLCVVIACRTFDLENDPQIKEWIQQEKEKSVIKINDLSSGIDNILKRLKVNPAIFSKKQKKIISSPIMLKMWLDISQTREDYLFQTASALMQQFFEEKYIKIERQGVPEHKVKEILFKIVNWMDDSGELNAPVRLISNQKVLTELQTHGILRRENNKLIFCHQSYLDYLVADNLLEKIFTSGEHILNWLKEERKQNLLCRERFKLALALLADQDMECFALQCIQILESDSIRFHLKQLTLQVIGSIALPPKKLLLYLIELFDKCYWHEHVLRNVFTQSLDIALWLNDNGYIYKWINDQPKKEYALRILRTHTKHLSMTIQNIFAPLIEKDENSAKDLASTFAWYVENDTEELFRLRLKLLEFSWYYAYVNWDELAKRYPKRFIEYLYNYEFYSHNHEASHHDDDLDSEAIKEFQNVARKYPLRVWETFMPYVIEKTNFQVESYYQHGLEDWGIDRIFKRKKLKHGIVIMLVEAGKKLAKFKPENYIKFLRTTKECKSFLVKEIIIKSIVNINKNYSDKAIGWFIEKPDRMQLELYEKQGKWQPVATAVRELSPYCSQKTLEKLEVLINSLFDKQDQKYWKHCLKDWTHGWNNLVWGQAQYFLLPALDPQRRSQKTNDLIKVLKRKFERYSFKPSSSTGGFITSPIHNKLHSISDNAWLGIIHSKKLKDGHNSTRWKQYDDDTATEASIEQFSRSLQYAAEQNPKRFIKLGLLLSDDVDPRYLDAIMNCFQKMSAPDKISEEIKSNWQACPIELIEDFFYKYFNTGEPGISGNNREIATDLCWMIYYRAEENWSDRIIKIMLYYAINHEDPEQDKLNIHSNEPGEMTSSHSLYTNTLNSVRSIATMAIGQLLWHHKEMYKDFLPTIEKLTDDHHVVVRMAVIEVILPVINIDKKQAIEWFIKICKSDLRIAVPGNAIKVFNYTAQEYYPKLRDVVLMMLDSDITEVEGHGAGEIVARNIFYGQYSGEIDSVLHGSVSKRKGVAEVTASLSNNEKYSEQCKPMVAQLLNDPEKDVRDKAVAVFYNYNLSLENQDLILTFTAIP